MIVLKKIKIKNYKSIKDSSYINIDPKITVLSGKNNTGKTAFIEVLNKIFMNSPVSGIDNGLTDDFEVEIEIKINDINSHIHKLFGEESSGELVIRFYKWNNFVNYDVIDINKKCKLYKAQRSDDFVIENCINASTYIGGMKKNQNYIGFYNELANNFLFISGSRNVPVSQNISKNQDSLDSNATKFHTFMFTLHNNNELIFDNIKSTFCSIFDDVRDVQTSLVDGPCTKVNLVFDNMEDVPIALSECGSGYTHVLILLAILYSQSNKVIFYDEPHAFLHPSAEKAIYDLSTQHPTHQFIFTTHSPILINYPINKCLYLVKKENGISQYKSLDKVKEVLNEIGIVNSDFAFADKVIFVEGETEEEIIPNILNVCGIKQFGYNYKILNMKGTGKEFKKKSAMVNNLNKIDLIMDGLNEYPIPYIILIDRDERDKQKINDLKSVYGDKIIVLQRREIENYFLASYDAILECIKEFCEENVNICSNDIQAFIEDCMKNINDKNLYPKESDNPIVDIKGSRVLELLFEQYSLSYSKVFHGKIITNWLIENNPSVFEEIVLPLSTFLGAKLTREI